MYEDWIEQGFLQVNGTSVPRPFEMRFVRYEELEALFRLHQAVVAVLDHPHLFRPDSRAFMARHLEARGRTVGTFVDGDLIAYAAISFPNDDPDNLGRDLPLPQTEFKHVADYDGSAVHPNYRGNGLQQKMTNMRHRYALAHDRYHILGTVSPLNARSLANFLAIGCRVKNIKEKYGGMLRLIIHRDLRDERPLVFDPTSVRDVPCAAAARITSLLREGFQGFRVVIDEQGAKLRMGHPDRCLPAPNAILPEAVGLALGHCASAIAHPEG
jgi:Uncharacterized conserved protein